MRARKGLVDFQAKPIRAGDAGFGQGDRGATLAHAQRPARRFILSGAFSVDAGQLGRAARTEAETNGAPKRDDGRPPFAPRPGGDSGAVSQLPGITET